MTLAVLALRAGGDRSPDSQTPTIAIYTPEIKKGMSVDHTSGVKKPQSDPIFLHVKAGMTVIVEDGCDWRMADVIWVDGGSRNPRVSTLFKVADVETGIINWVNANLVTHIVPKD